MSNENLSNGSPSATPWYYPGVADLIFLIVGLVVLRGADHTMLDDPGLGWHLRNVDAMLAQGWWLSSDPFTEPGPEGPRPHRTNQWLGEVPYWLGWRWGGLEGIAVVNALIIAFMARLFYRMQLADGLPWPVAVIWTALVAVGTSCSWTARPNVFTILFVLIFARVCVLFHEGRVSARQTFWLWPLFALWANIHGGFVAGFILLGATLGVEGAVALGSLDAEQRKTAWQRAGHLALLIGGGILATFANPYGPGLYSWVFQLLGDPFFMDLHQEWRSPDFHGAGAMRFELLMLLFPLLLGLSARRPHLVELGLSVIWLHFALTGFRYVALWVVVVGPLLARSSVAIPYLQELAKSWGLADTPDNFFANRPGRTPWVWTAVILVAFLGGARLAQGTFARHKPEIIAAPILDRFLEIHRDWRARHERRPVIFHSYDWGGYLTWHGWPNALNWIDDRNEVQGKKRIKDYFILLNAKPGWEQKLREINPDLICIESGAALTQQLAANPKEWKEITRDDYGAIFERRKP